MPKRVFILGGGAALGAHQVGGMRYLDEQGIVPDAIVGSSIGVVNACLYATGGVANVEEAWLRLPRMSSIFRPSLSSNPITGLSLFSIDPLADAIERFVDFDAVLASPLEVSFTLLNLSRGEGQFVSNHQLESSRELRTLMRAGYSIPLLFPPVRYHKELYVDGGLAWNVPLLQAIEMGATEIYVLAVVATALPFKSRFRRFPDYLMRLTDVMWRTLGNVGYVTTRIDDDGTYRGIPVTVLQPTEELSGFNLLTLLSTSPARSRRLITFGYRDAKRELARQRRAASPGIMSSRSSPPSGTGSPEIPASHHGLPSPQGEPVSSIDRQRHTARLATLSFVVHGDDVLLLRHPATSDRFRGQWNGIGGHVEAGEDVRAAARRELREEAGLDVKELSLRGVVHEAGVLGHDYVLFVFVGQAPERGVSSAEGLELAWHPIATLDQLLLVHDVAILLSRALEAREPFFATETYDGGERRTQIAFDDGGGSRV